MIELKRKVPRLKSGNKVKVDILINGNKAEIWVTVNNILVLKVVDVDIAHVNGERWL